MSVSIAREDGAAMVMVIMAIGLIASLAVALLLTSSSEVIIASHFRDQRVGFYAAEAIAERVLNDLAAADWNAVIVGAVRSTFIDGPPAGTRTVHGGTSIDLVRAVNLANCQKSTACTVSELDAVTAQRPWGVNNPRWQLFGYGRMRDLLPSSAIDVPWYAILLAGDDPAHAADVIAVRAEAFGPRGAHAVLELIVARADPADSDYNDPSGGSAVKILSWREVR